MEEENSRDGAGARNWAGEEGTVPVFVHMSDFPPHHWVSAKSIESQELLGGSRSASYEARREPHIGVSWKALFLVSLQSF